MDFKLMPQKFDQLQNAFIGDIVDKIYIKLREAGLEGEQLQESTAAIASSVASIIDDTAAIELDGHNVNPYLTFRGEGEDEFIHSGENAYTHQFIFDHLSRLFK